MTWQDINEQQKQAHKFEFDYGPLLDFILSKLPSNPLVVELGTFMGCSAVYLLQNPVMAAARMYTVDTFLHYAGRQNFFIESAKNFKACGCRDRIRMLTCLSWEAACLFDEQEVDFVWIDAGHSFANCSRDIEAWQSKIKPGGFLAGHDLSEAGVLLAVEKFCFATGRTHNVFNPTGWKSWWIQL